MTIDDELILELIKPERDGKVGEKALIIGIVGQKEISYKLEESTQHTITYGSRTANKLEIVKITPDILVKVESGTIKTTSNGGLIASSDQYLAIEIENDIQWDFQDSLKQLKKYKINFPDTRVIIPKDYERFAPLYKKEGFRVYLWKAIRRWQCLKCGIETVKEGPITPICSNSKCKNHNQNEFRLVGVEDANIEEFM